MLNIQIKNDKGSIQTFDTFVFNGGEVSVKINNAHPSMRFFHEANSYKIIARVQNSNDLFGIALIKNALEKIKKLQCELILPYVPYARQDRICDDGEAFSLQVLSQFINSMNFSGVTIYDPHSDVSPALLNNVKIISQADIFVNCSLFQKIYNQGYYFVSADAGANKKTAKLANLCEHKSFVRADKLRDCSNGKILETVVYGDVPEKVIIADDICEGGATFEALAKELKKRGVKEIILFVTHGIFSRGFQHLFDAGITEIYTTDSFDLKIAERTKEFKNINIIKI